MTSRQSDRDGDTSSRARLPGEISQGFGCTPFTFEPYSSTCPTHHVHPGIDIAAARGTPVRAAAAGVAHVVTEATGLGLHVVVTHGGGWVTLYGHLDGVVVSDGATVARGQIIGEVGTSGNSTGPHLHFEVRHGGVPVDPRPLLALA